MDTNENREWTRIVGLLFESIRVHSRFNRRELGSFWSVKGNRI